MTAAALESSSGAGVDSANRERLAGWMLVGCALLVLTWGMINVGHWFAAAGDMACTTAFTAVYMATGIVLLAGLGWLRRGVSTRRVMGWIILAGLVMRLVAFTETPEHSDLHRYLWDGAVTAHGYNPYAIGPVDVVEHQTDSIPTDEVFAALAEAGRATLQEVNNPHLTTIYPPVAQAFFALAYRISPFSIDALRMVFLTAEMGTLILLLGMLRHLSLPLHWVAIYWWNPIAIKEFYISAHMDSLACFFALAAVCAVVWRWRRTGIVLLGVAMGVKLWPVALAPILLRYGARSWRHAAAGLALLGAVAGVLLWPLAVSWGGGDGSGVNAYAHHWINNAGLFSVIHWAAEAVHHVGVGVWSDPHQFARQLTFGLVVVWMLILSRRSLPDGAAVCRWSMLAIGGIFVLSPTQFPWYYTWLLPFLALAPCRPLLLYTALLPLYILHYDYPWVLWIEHLPVWLMIGWCLWRQYRLTTLPRVSAFTEPEFTPPSGLRVAVVIPALNEERAIGRVLGAIPRWAHQVIVADNGSTDQTAAIAKACGAVVVLESRRGYGAACLGGIAALDRPDIVVFLDGDFSDDPRQMGRLLEPIALDEADLVIGSRVLGLAETGALSPQQRFGNALACWLIGLLYQVRYTDLGPFRAIRYGALQRLAMDDRGYGWTVQMQVRAARLGLRCVEVPVNYRKRLGRSKISGTIGGVIGAGSKIISTIFREGLRSYSRHAAKSKERLIILARYPQPGRAKTRLMPLLGSKGAAGLHRQLVRMALHTARRVAVRRGAAVEVRSTGAVTTAMASLFGDGITYRDQGDGDLGERLHRAADEAIVSGAERVVLIGTDCPLLTADRLDEAFEALSDRDVVIGPATDGGYYLIGMKSAHRELVTGIQWGGPDVLEQTLAICRRLGLRVTLLPALADVDTPDDLATWAAARLVPTGAAPRVSVIIPALNEQEHLAATLGSVLAAEGIEIIVVGGQNGDRTADIAQKFGATFIASEPSRGVQLNLGAARARGKTLLFLHADTLLPPDYATAIRQTLFRPDVSAGAFDLGIDAGGLGLRVIEWGVRIRSRVFGRPYGDQAIFMAAQTYGDCGGFPCLPYMEDYAMLPRLRKHGRIDVNRSRVLTSARRWKELGVIRTTLFHQWFILMYRLGRGPKPQPDKDVGGLKAAGRSSPKISIQPMPTTEYRG